MWLICNYSFLKFTDIVSIQTFAADADKVKPSSNVIFNFHP